MCWCCMTSNFPHTKVQDHKDGSEQALECLLTLDGLLSASYWVKEQVSVVKVMTALCLQCIISL